MSFTGFVQILSSVEWGAVGGIIAAFCALIATIIALCCYMHKQVMSFAGIVEIDSAAFNCTFNLNFQLLSKDLKLTLQVSLAHSGSHQSPPYLNQCTFILIAVVSMLLRNTLESEEGLILRFPHLPCLAK